MAEPDSLTLVLDVDGTLVDSNFQHAIAWHRAFRDHGYHVAIWEIHRHIGMGGDQLVEAVLGEEGENADGDELRDAHSEEFAKLIGEVEAVTGASELVAEAAAAGATVILSSSAADDEIEHYLELLGARERVAGWTTESDAEHTKPHPELVETALRQFGTDGPVLMVGDSTWDVRAAEAAGIPTLALLTGGFSEAELREAGAVEVVGALEAIREMGTERLAGLARARSTSQQ